MNDNIAFVYPEQLPDKKARAVSVINTSKAMSLYLPTILIYCENACQELSANRELKLVKLKKSFGWIQSNRIFNFMLSKHLKSNHYRYFYVRHLKTASHLLKNRPKDSLIVFEAHEIFHTQNPKTESLEKFVYKNADAFVFTNATLMQICETTFPHLKKKPRMIVNNGSDFSMEFVEKDFTSLDTLYYIGNFYEWKGVDIAIDAMRYLPDMKLRIIGDGSRKEYLKSLVKKYKLEKRVSFLGYLPHYEVLSHLVNAKMTLIPNSISMQNLYSTPIKLYEYMATSNIVIASDMPTIREIIKDGENGFLFKTGDPKSLANVVSRIRKMSQYDLTKISMEAYKTSKSYTWDSRGKKITEFLKKLGKEHK